MADSADSRRPGYALPTEAGSHLRARQTGLLRRPATSDAWAGDRRRASVHPLGDNLHTHAVQTAALHFPSRTDLSNSR